MLKKENSAHENGFTFRKRVISPQTLLKGAFQSSHRIISIGKPKAPINKSCQKTTTLAGRQPSLNSSQRLSFSQVGQTSRSRSRGKKIWYHVKGLVTRNTHVQYESPISSGFKVMSQVKVFSKVGQTSRSRSRGQNYGTM